MASLSRTIRSLVKLEEKLDDINSAKKHLEESVETYRELPETPQYLDNWSNALAGLAKLEAKLGDTDAAKKHFEEGLEIARRINNEKYINAFEEMLSSL